MKYVVAIVAAALAGCAKEVPTAQPVNVMASDFCKIQRTKITWDVKDTRPTIEQIRRLNAKWDQRCGNRATS